MERYPYSLNDPLAQQVQEDPASAPVMADPDMVSITVLDTVHPVVVEAVIQCEAVVDIAVAGHRVAVAPIHTAPVLCEAEGLPPQEACDHIEVVGHLPATPLVKDLLRIITIMDLVRIAFPPLLDMPLTDLNPITGQGAILHFDSLLHPHIVEWS